MYLNRFSAPAALALVLGLTAPLQAGPDLPPLALPDPMPAPAQTVLLPVPETRIDAAIATLDDLGADVLARSGIPGLAIAVVHGGQTVYARGFGQRAVDRPDPVDADTVFLLASLSKSVGATVIASQVSAGRVGWTSLVQSYLPEFDLGDPWVSAHVTVGDLYAHRSGLPDHAGDDLEDLGYDRDTVLSRLGMLPQAPFRAHYAYTNFGLTAAALAVATATGTDWASLSERALYAPLGMASTSSRYDDYRARDNRAASHIRNGDSFVVADLRQPDAQSPAGGVSSSVHDMARWMAMVLAGGGDLIDVEALRPALAPQMTDGLPLTIDARAGTYGYGFGVGVRPSGRVTFSHSGAFALGASTTYLMIPDLDLGIVVLTNALPTGAAEAIAASFADRVELGLDSRDWLAGYAALMAPVSAPVGSLVGVPRPTAPAPAQPDSVYVGRYGNGYFGPAIVTARDGGLRLHLGPQDHGQDLAMEHWDGDTFIVHPFTENQPAGSISRIDFLPDGTGALSVLRIEHLDDLNLGLFEREE
ncbi:serine hydrolase [Pseudodonghicola flavimaris]|uniref:Serine hydrolase n=1 Tax=Pseudodonghicola flavimaris TaxID=3050036 RepID=A0ABT7EVG1_9RHOB|nr:serine hydrolase [Pseudodonghicola flavimaris]MDK3016320.1 serine hydrolase [Pseudodonghicola flavimaris]